MNHSTRIRQADAAFTNRWSMPVIVTLASAAIFGLMALLARFILSTRALILILVLLTGAGCVSSQVKQQLRDASAVAQADERDWDRLSPSEKKIAAHDHAKTLCTLDYGINGTPIPPAYVDVAPVSS